MSADLSDRLIAVAVCLILVVQLTPALRSPLVTIIGAFSCIPMLGALVAAGLAGPSFFPAVKGFIAVIFSVNAVVVVFVVVYVLTQMLLLRRRQKQGALP